MSQPPQAALVLIPDSLAIPRCKEERMPKEGGKAPDFTTVDHTGNEVKLSDLEGKKVWLWFFSSPGGGN